MNSQEYYETLGVTHQSTQDEIRKAYRRLSLVHHPDRNGGTDDSEFQKLNEAYETLSDPQKRRIYDITRQNPFMHGNAMHGNAMHGNVMEVPIDAASLFSMLFSQELGNDPDIHVFQGSIPMGGMHNVKMPFHMPEPEPIVKTTDIKAAPFVRK